MGPVSFRESTAAHIEQALLPIVDRTLAALGLPTRGFHISVANLGMAATADIGISISGFSSDVPVLISLLSAALGMPVPGDMVTTGHVASPDGDIAAVRAIPAKLAAAVADVSAIAALDAVLSRSTPASFNGCAA